MSLVQAKDISWLEFLQLISDDSCTAYEKLCEKYPEKVVIAKYQIADKKGYIEWGVALRRAWLEPKGIETLLSFGGKHTERTLKEAITNFKQKLDYGWR